MILKVHITTKTNLLKQIEYRQKSLKKAQLNWTCCRSVWPSLLEDGTGKCKKYDKQDLQGKVAFNERNPHTTQQQEQVAGVKALA
jgi:hypothetical protein